MAVLHRWVHEDLALTSPKRGCPFDKEVQREDNPIGNCIADLRGILSSTSNAMQKQCSRLMCLLARRCYRRALDGAAQQEAWHPGICNQEPNSLNKTDEAASKHAQLLQSEAFSRNILHACHSLDFCNTMRKDIDMLTTIIQLDQTWPIILTSAFKFLQESSWERPSWQQACTFASNSDQAAFRLCQRA